jgi:hypothetical protein
MSLSSCCRIGHFCSRSRSSISRCWLAPLWQCLALKWLRSSRGVITKDRAIMSISNNGTSMSIQSLPTLKTKGCSFDSVTKSWMLPIKNSLSKRLACLRWNWLLASRCQGRVGWRELTPRFRCVARATCLASQVSHQRVHSRGAGPFPRSYFKVLASWKDRPNRGRASWFIQGL